MRVDSFCRSFPQSSDDESHYIPYPKITKMVSQPVDFLLKSSFLFHLIKKTAAHFVFNFSDPVRMNSVELALKSDIFELIFVALLFVCGVFSGALLIIATTYAGGNSTPSSRLINLASVSSWSETGVRQRRIYSSPAWMDWRASRKPSKRFIRIRRFNCASFIWFVILCSTFRTKTAKKWRPIWNPSIRHRLWKKPIISYRSSPTNGKTLIRWSSEAGSRIG